MKRLLYLFSIASLLMLAACSKDDDDGNGSTNITDVVDPKPSWVAKTGGTNVSNPKWEPMEDETPYSSMTAVISLGPELSKTITENDTLAAFCDSVCIGVVAPTNLSKDPKAPDWRFHLYIQHPPKNNNKRISLHYYCDSLKQLFYWPEKLTFSNDYTVGSNPAPYVLKDEDENHGYPTTIMTFYYEDDMTIDWKAGDELAVFCGDTCLSVIEEKDYIPGLYYYVDLPAQNEKDSIHLRYYSAAKHRVYRTEAISDEAGILLFTLSFDRFKR